MVPLPYRVELALGGPLQRLATRASTIVLQTAGWPALEEGNIITMGHSKIGVVEACNGLSMLTFFFAISVGSILVVRRAWIERTLIIAGAIPIALIANIARITATGLLVESVGHGVAGLEFHDLAGYLMMPFALALLYIEITLVSHLFIGPGLQPIRPSERRDLALPSPSCGSAREPIMPTVPRYEAGLDVIHSGHQHRPIREDELAAD
jgi:exosortase/archaeosortase family protein